ncbi:zinc-binding metallopeptidase family protein [Zobellia laminariae]|uniref:zinc-binding metallopeptidase family protein n=1 Tax=Zobellia laminariae TaxID=248906 RepID=UPI0026F41ACA|nr:putative zinc-binding metallopeptidase [Zobellia laminariae]WKX76718.1 putative zinc-binding metallopeptidase [Zobellia laminariae]
MKKFTCQHCSNVVYFENHTCVACKQWLGYEPISSRMLATNAQQNVPTFQLDGRNYHYCSNHQHHVCNWLIEANGADTFCEACKLNRTIPNLSVKDYLDEWKNIEMAKHRLIYALKRWKLPFYGTTAGSYNLEFNFLSKDEKLKENQSAMTGHANGLVTINLAEADAISREQARQELEEPYRTLIGHFRHEVGHYYWDRLIYENQNNLTAFRNLFGDDRADYGQALELHYKKEHNYNWKGNYISKYASSHPWEDWAETWAHYLHMVDMVDTALNFGLLTNVETNITDAYYHPNFTDIFEAIVPLSIAVNSLNRSMGQPDVYPFVVPQNVLQKLEFVHAVLRNYNS